MIPNLARLYVESMKEVYGVTPMLSERTYPKFLEREVDLMRNGINAKMYTWTVAACWRKWTESKNLKFLPPQVFLGDRSRIRFVRYRLRYPTVNLAVARLTLLRAEAISLERDIASSLVQELLACAEIDEQTYFDEALLWYDPADPRVIAWRYFEETNQRREIRLEVINYFCKQTGVKQVSSSYSDYSDYVTMLRQTRERRKISMESRFPRTHHRPHLIPGVV